VFGGQVLPGLGLTGRCTSAGGAFGCFGTGEFAGGVTVGGGGEGGEEVVTDGVVGAGAVVAGGEVGGDGLVTPGAVVPGGGGGGAVVSGGGGGGGAVVVGGSVVVAPAQWSSFCPPWFPWCSQSRPLSGWGSGRHSLPVCPCEHGSCPGGEEAESATAA